MSVYYGQPSYGASNFSPSPIPNAYPVVSTHNIYQMDPATFRREYSNRLAELTVNSRPLIQNLSMMAHEYSRFADIVAQCLEAHIRKVPPWVKLPVFYLLDMISKNIYEPYARHFSRFVVTLFIEAYQQVDEATRSKMVELALTWRTGSPTAKELFGVPAQVAIERSIWGDAASVGPSLVTLLTTAKIAIQSTNTGFYTGVGQITKAQVISELEFTLGQKERGVQANPNDATSKTHVSVLQQLRKVIEAGVSQNELQQILNQLRNLMRNNAQPPPPAAPFPAQWPQNHFATSPAVSFPPPPSSIPGSLLSYPVSTFQTEPYASIGSTSTSVLTPVPAASPSTQTTDFAGLLSTLVKAGVVSTNGTPVGAGATIHEPAAEDQHAVKTERIVSEGRDASRVYRNLVLSYGVQLTTSGITKSQPPIHDMLYEHLGAQCKQCGIRFLNDASGKKALESHLDMHFRQNLRANQNIGRGHSRSWFVGVEDWVHDIKGKGRADGSRVLGAKAAAEADLAERDAKLRSEFVVVPPGDEAKSISCPICKEPLKSEFVEDDEEWVWKNAVKKDDRIFHATCHAEASTNVLAARLRSDINSRSRSGTPEKSPRMARLSLSPSSAQRGIKRKVDDDNSSVSGDAEGTPQHKKLAGTVL
ncbi:hypothetical protein D9757_002694 [Collybiopsis confluens]|uniref:CID domain-containing protein n=1 Tax=Collybiopsis confluens TaxID=2823264 RepID=A0A8H5HVW3_9AGAR|nr:hypothetical protein D9757_002694 [Collybiopsis confluens]